MPLFSPFCPHSGLSRCSGPAGVVPMLFANQDREEGRNGSPFAPVAGGLDAPERTEAGPRNGSPPPPNKTRNTTRPAAPMMPECSRCCQPIGNGSPQGQRERNKEKRGGEREREREAERGKPTSPQRKGHPPLSQRAGLLSPHHKFAPKNQQKVALGRFEKIFGKIFRGNVSGERKTPCVISTEGGCLTNENREISNLAMQITKNAQKHYLITDGKGREKESHLQGNQTKYATQDTSLPFLSRLWSLNWSSLPQRKSYIPSGLDRAL